MMSLKSYFIILLLLFICFSCLDQNPNQQTEEVVSKRHVNEYNIDTLSVDKKTTVYVPIYSDIYNQTKDSRVLLTATLSIRNTSETDTLFLSRVDYFDTQGHLVRHYIDESIYLNPLESLDYVIEEKDDTGGSGANFLIDWYSKRPMKPMFQAVMTGGLAGRAFAFTTIGVEIHQ